MPKPVGEAEQAYYVMDSAVYSEDNLKAMEMVHWLTRVPETLKQAKKLVVEPKKTDMQPLEEGYWGKKAISEYRNIRQRWLVVFSDSAQQRDDEHQGPELP